ncbi:MAG: fructose PTS transporter subunit IIA, partial [Cetobacterium sp.]
MNLLDATKSELILLDVEATSKNEVISKLVDLIDKNGYLTNKDAFYNAVMEREKISPTGLENGLATPHGKSEAVKKPVFAVAKMKNPIDEWESVDEDNRVDIVFLLGIPAKEAGTTHIEILTNLTSLFINDDFTEELKYIKKKQDLLDLIDKYSEKKKEEANKTVDESQKIILCVTACATGIAHTFMAAEALEKAGRKLGITVYTEKQGASGIEGKFSKDLIQKADAVIFATDVAVKEKGRFTGKNFIQTRVAEPLRKSEELLKKSLENPEGKVLEVECDNSSEENLNLRQEISKAILTGISYMIPVIVAGGLMMGLSKLVALPFGDIEIFGSAKYLALHPGKFFEFLVSLDKFGGFIYKFIYPVFAAYVAFSLSDKSGLVPGFIGGAFAGGLHYTFWNTSGVPSGFFGALILGLLAGYSTKLGNDKIKLSKNLKALKPMLIIPAIGAITIFIANTYFVDPIFGGLNKFLQEVIKQNESSKYLLSSLIAAFTAFDLGGPINKAAGAIAIGLASDK